MIPDKIICAGKTAAGKQCTATGWLPHEGLKYCTLHDPLRFSRKDHELHRTSERKQGAACGAAEAGVEPEVSDVQEKHDQRPR